MMDDLPKAISSSTMRLFGVDVRCHVLDNGQRIIEANSMAELWAAMAEPNEQVTKDEIAAVEEFARWMRGK